MSDTPKNWTVSQDGGVVELLLNRPDVRNALDASTIVEGIQLFERLGHEDQVRVIVLGGTGKTFCAGADLNYMVGMRSATDQENQDDALRLGRFFHTIAMCPKPVVARVSGAALGGGAGMVAAADIAVAASDTVFAFSEVRLGIIPAVISPFLVRRMGAVRSRRAILSGYRFDAVEALRLGLVDVAVAPGELTEATDKIVKDLLVAGPHAVAAAKELLEKVDQLDVEAALPETAARISKIRRSPEAQEGMTAFLEKRKPSWVAGS